MKCTLTFALLFFLNYAFSQNNALNYLKKLQNDQNPLYSGFKGSFSVSDMGSATYDIPFAVTPGIAGMTPKLSITYNSGSSTSILGEGWSLSGFSYISRSPNSIVTDSASQAIMFNSEDKLSLDGSRLINITNDAKYGSENTVYITEQNGYKRITIEEVSGHAIDGIKYIKVNSKDGLDYYYGELSDHLLGQTNGIVRTNKTDQNNIAYMWLLTIIKDKNGNWIKFDYDISSNFYKPKKITYGGTENSNPIGEITFAYYDEGKSGNQWGWTNQKYIQGQQISIDKPLASITSRYLAPNNEKFMVRTFHFEYSYEALSNKLMLNKIYQSVKQGKSTKLIVDSNNAIQFDWNTTNLKRREFIDTLVVKTKETVKLEEDYKITIADFNGDGFPDKLMHKNFGDKLCLLPSINDTKGKFLSLALDTIAVNINKNAKSFTGDFNADGRNDLIYLENKKDSLNVYQYISQVNNSGTFMGFKQIVSHRLLKLPDIDNKLIKFGFGDFNSDGFSDLMIHYFEKEKLKYQSLTFHPDTIIVNKLLEADKGDIPTDNYLVQLVDINGDGVSDFFFSWTNSSGWFTRSLIFKNSRQLGLISTTRVNKLSNEYLNYNMLSYSIDTTRIADQVPSTIVKGDYSKLGNIMLSDINKDGNIDIIISNTGKDGWEYYVAIGKGTGEFDFKDKKKITQEVFNVNQRSSFGDFNGDGNLDIIIQRTDQLGWHKLIAYGNSKGEFYRKNDSLKFENILTLDFSYSQRYPTNNVLPFVYKSIYKKLFIEKLTPVNDCKNMDNHECLLSNIRMIFPEETGFYPNQVRIFDQGMSDPLRKFIKTDLNFENNVKRVIGASYTGDSLVTSIGGSYKYYSKITFGDFWQPYVADLNGDGISDLLLTYPIHVPSDTALHLAKNELEDNLFTFSFINQSHKPGMIKEITHSNKNKIFLAYGSVLHNSTNSTNLNSLSYPFIRHNTPVYTIAKMAVSNGNSINSTRVTTYAFNNGVYSLNGRGFLGYENQIVTNEANHNFSIKSFWIRPDFLTAGYMPVKNIQTFIKGYSKSVSEENFEYLLSSRVESRYYSLFLTRQTSNTHDLEGISTSNIETVSIYDGFGNLTTSKIKKGDHGITEIIKEINNTYWENEDPEWEKSWLLGRLKSSTVKITRNGKTTERIGNFEYNAENGQLIKEVSDVQDRKLSLTKNYILNKYGNIEQSTIYPTYDNTEKKSQTTISKYSKDNRFVVETIDAGGYITTKNTEPVQGLMLSTSFAEEGNTQSVEADVLGRYQAIKTPDGLISKVETRICNTCEFKNIASYFTIQNDNLSGQPKVNFYNTSNQLVRKINFDYKDRLIVTEYEYNNNGNLKRQSLPHFRGQKVNNTNYQYDKLGRQTLTILPDQTKVRKSYDGLIETITNAKGQRIISRKNILGELDRSIDENGFYINYEYDAFGRVIYIIDKDNHTYAMDYDINGNRIKYKNPNFSNAEIKEYDAFGLNIKTIDPNGYPKEYEYDNSERLLKIFANRPGMKERIEYAYIGQSDKISGKGKVKSIKSYSDDHPVDEEFTYFKNGQLKTHLYKYFSLNERVSTTRSNVFTYNGDKQKDNLEYSFTYDRGQIKTITYPYTGSSKDKRFIVEYGYTNGTLTKATGKNIDTKKTFNFWELINTNAMGAITEYKLGDSISSNNSFDSTVFNLTSTKYSIGQKVLAGMEYGYDSIGNLIFRQDVKKRVLNDSIFYDNLNRIIEVKTNGYSTKASYNDNGDIKQKIFGKEYKLDFSYIAGTNHFNSIDQTNLKTHKTFKTKMKYDGYGNEDKTLHIMQSQDDNENITYNQYNLPYQIDNLRFYYGFEGAKTAIYDFDNHIGTSFLGNLSEFSYKFNNSDNNGSLQYHKINILVNGKIVANYYTHNNGVSLLLKDALNTVIAISDIKGKLTDSMSYDPWGLRRKSSDWTYDWKNESDDLNAKGFLNTSSFEKHGLSDFGARLYNPLTGRFHGVDQVVSNKFANTQFINSYLYGNNNPTIIMDANGKWGFIVVAIVAAYIGGSAAGGSLLPWQWNENWWKGALVGVVSVAGGYVVAGPAMFTGGMTAGTAILSGAAAGFAGGFTSTIVNGGNFSQALENGFKGGVIGCVTAGFSYGIGSAFNGSTGVDSYLAKASLHGINQGLQTEASGGSFEHGFLAGSFTTLAQPLTKLASTPQEKVVISSMIGGTSSSIGGGKFANGALSGAMVQIYNENQHSENIRKRAFEHWKNGNGNLLTVKASDVNVCGLNTSDFNGIGDKKAISTLYYDPDNFPALGTITVKYIGGSEVRIYNDTFDWEMHDLSKANGLFDASKEFGRNLGTVIGRSVIGTGQEFEIGFKGATPIDCAPKATLPRDIFIGPKY